MSPLYQGAIINTIEPGLCGVVITMTSRSLYEIRKEQLFEHLCAEAVAHDNRAAEEAAKASDGDGDDY